MEKQAAATQRLREASVSAVVIRADGSRVDLGVVAYTHKSRWRRILWTLAGSRRAKRLTTTANGRLNNE